MTVNMISWPATQRLSAISVLDSHLQAGVEAPSLLFLLCRRGIEPHKAIIPQDNGRTTWQIVEMCFLPLDQGWRELHEDALAQLMAGMRKHEGQREGKTSNILTFYSPHTWLTFPYFKLRVWRDSAPSAKMDCTSACQIRKKSVQKRKS